MLNEMFKLLQDIITITECMCMGHSTSAKHHYIYRVHGASYCVSLRRNPNTYQRETLATAYSFWVIIDLFAASPSINTS